jgi:hypothetical protein
MGISKIGLDRLNLSQSFPVDMNIGNHRITNLANPTASNDAATKSYVDGVGGSRVVSYTITHDANTIYGYDLSGVLIQSASYSSPGGFATVLNAIISDINTKDIGAQIVISPGVYYPGDVDILEIPPFVTVSGCNYPFSGTYDEALSLTSPEITRICITNTTNIPIKLYNNGSSIEKVSFFYPNQTGASTIVEYAATIKIAAHVAVDGVEGNVISYVDLGNAYRGIDLGKNAERAIIEHVVGYPLKYGIVQSVDEIYDIIDISDIHFNPKLVGAAGYYDGTIIPDWVKANGIALSINRIDGLRVDKFFCIFYNIGINIIGPLYRAHFNAFYLDACNYGIFSGGATIGMCDFSNGHVFCNIIAFYVYNGYLYYNSFIGIEIESYRDGVKFDLSSDSGGNVFTGCTVRAHRDSDYTTVTRCGFFSGKGFIITSNTFVGIVSTYLQGLYIFNGLGFVISNNYFTNLEYSTIEIDGTATTYQISGNISYLTGPFPSDVNTNGKFIGHNVYSS